MKVVDVLRAARKKIERPEAWTKIVYAKDARGREVEFDDKKAACFCSMGAIMSIVRSNQSPLFDPVRQALLRACNDYSVASFNDSHTHAEVLAAFDRAIAAEEAK